MIGVFIAAFVAVFAAVLAVRVGWQRENPLPHFAATVDDSESEIIYTIPDSLLFLHRRLTEEIAKDIESHGDVISATFDAHDFRKPEKRFWTLSVSRNTFDQASSEKGSVLSVEALNQMVHHAFKKNGIDLMFVVRRSKVL